MSNNNYRNQTEHLRELSDEHLHDYFWQLVDQMVDPILEEARTHTTPSLERSILLRMGFSSVENKIIVDKLLERGLLGHGAGNIVLNLARKKGIPVRAAGLALINDELWQEVEK